jgi:hypothetical protein
MHFNRKTEFWTEVTPDNDTILKVRTKTWTGDQQINWVSWPQFGEWRDKNVDFHRRFLPYYKTGHHTGKNRILYT